MCFKQIVLSSQSSSIIWTHASSTGISQLVSRLSTIQAQCGLNSVFKWKLVHLAKHHSQTCSDIFYRRVATENEELSFFVAPFSVYPHWQRCHGDATSAWRRTFLFSWTLLCSIEPGIKLVLSSKQTFYFTHKQVEPEKQIQSICPTFVPPLQRFLQLKTSWQNWNFEEEWKKSFFSSFFSTKSFLLKTKKKPLFSSLPEFLLKASSSDVNCVFIRRLIESKSSLGNPAMIVFLRSWAAAEWPSLDNG